MSKDTYIQDHTIEVVKGSLTLDASIATNKRGLKVDYTSNPIDIEFDLSPKLGGWTRICYEPKEYLILQSATGGVISKNVSSPPASADVNYRAPIPLVANIAADDLSTVRYKVISLTCSITANGEGGIIYFKKISKSSGVETNLLTCDRSNLVDNNSDIPIDLDTKNYSYCLQFFHASLLQNEKTDIIKNVILKIRKYSVE